MATIHPNGKCLPYVEGWSSEVFWVARVGDKFYRLRSGYHPFNEWDGPHDSVEAAILPRNTYGHQD